MKITFWGVRGSIAAPGPDTVQYGGNTTCVEIETSSGKTIVIDAGTGMRNLGDSLVQRNKHKDILLLMTHIHWDHLMGFPFFAPLFKKDVHLVVDGFRRSMEGLKKIFSPNYIDGTWPIGFSDLQARIEGKQTLTTRPSTVDGVVITAHPIQHPQGGLGFKFREADRNLVFLTDNELLDTGWSGTSFKDFATFCQGADILIHDCQYTKEEIESRRGWGHSDMESVIRLATQADVKRLLLFHHDPWRTDSAIQLIIDQSAEFLDQANSTITVDAASEGTTIEL